MNSIFVSSTFRDMQSERDELMLNVVPAINKFANDLGQSLRLVDLRWGVNTTDMDEDESNERVLSVCLDEIDKSPYMIILIGERYGWVPKKPELMQKVANDKGHKLYTPIKSVTELEIEYGLLSEKIDVERCLVYFREPLPLDKLPESLRADYIEDDKTLFDKLLLLKQKIIDSGAKVKNYTCEWDSEKNCPIVPEDFAQMVQDDIKELFVEEFEEAHYLNWQEKENINAELFVENKVEQFSAREKLIAEYTSYIKNPHINLFMIKGESGSGKSSVMSKLYTDFTDEYENDTLFIACGNSLRSLSIIDVLKQILYKFEQIFEVGESDYDDLIAEELSTKLSEYAQIHAENVGSPVYIFCDALDQLIQDNDTTSLKWLPDSLPENVTIVISLLDEFNLPMFFPLQDNARIEVIGQLSQVERPEIVDGILRLHGKELDEYVKNALVRVQGASNPLYISMMVQRLIMLDSDDFIRIREYSTHQDAMDAINSYMLEIIRTTPNTVEEMSAEVLKEAAERIGENLCNEITALIAVTRHGLRESDIVAIFTAYNMEYNAVDFARYTNYLQPFFMYRSDGRIDFTHRTIRSGFLKNIDAKDYNDKILFLLSSLDVFDRLRMEESAWHMYKGDKKTDLIRFIESYTFGGVFNRRIVSPIHDIAVMDAKWLKELLEMSVEEGDLPFLEFFNSDFINSFVKTKSNYELLVSLLESLVPLGKKISAQEGAKDINATRPLASVYEHIGHYKIKLEDFEGALKAYLACIDVRKEVARVLGNADGTRVLAVSHDNLGDVHVLLENNNKATEAFLECGKLLAEIPKRDRTFVINEDISLNYFKLGNHYLKIGEYKNSVKTLTEGKNHAKDVYEANKNDENAHTYAGVLDSLGNTLLLMPDEQIDNALKLFYEAKPIFEELARKDRTPELYVDVCTNYICIGAAYMKAKKWDDAIEILQSAKDDLEHLVRQVGTKKAYDNLEVCYSNLIKVYTGKAEELEDIERDIEEDTELMNLYFKLGVLYSSFKAHNEVSEYFEKFEELAYELVGKGAPVGIYDVLQSHLLRAELYEEFPEKSTEMLISYMEALNLYREILSKDQEDDTVSSMYKVINRIVELTELFSDLDRDEVLFSGKAGVEEMNYKQTQSAQDLQKLELSLRILTEIYRRKGKLDDEIDARERHLSYFLIIALNSNNLLAMLDLTKYNTQLAESYIEQGNLQKAKETLDLGRGNVKSLMKQDMQVEVAAQVGLCAIEISDGYKQIGEKDLTLEMLECTRDISISIYDCYKNIDALQNLMFTIEKIVDTCDYFNVPSQKRKYEQELLMLKEELPNYTDEQN